MKKFHMLAAYGAFIILIFIEKLSDKYLMIATGIIYWMKPVKEDKID